MKTPMFIFTVLVLACLSALAQIPKSSTVEIGKASRLVAAVELIEGKVTSIESGDAITIQTKGQAYLVKLQAIDAPDSGQPYFENSRKSLSKLIQQKDVRVVVQWADTNGVFYGTVYRDGDDIGLKLVETGMAWYFKQTADKMTALRRTTYMDAQTYATTAGIGLWVDNRPTPPWVFRGETVSPTPKNIDHGTNAQASAPNPVAGSNVAHDYHLGPRGGCYYVSESGRRVYVQDKSLCGVSTPETKP